MRWSVPAVPATRGAEAGESSEPSSGLQCAMLIVCLHEVWHQYGDLLGVGDYQVA